MAILDFSATWKSGCNARVLRVMNVRQRNPKKLGSPAARVPFAIPSVVLAVRENRLRGMMM